MEEIVQTVVGTNMRELISNSKPVWTPSNTLSQVPFEESEIQRSENTGSDERESLIGTDIPNNEMEL